MLRISEIRAEYKETVSLPDYCNVTVGLALTGVPEANTGILVEVAYEGLMTVAREFCQEQIDAALRDAGQPPKHFAGPRYTLWRHEVFGAAILPAGSRLTQLFGWYDGTVNAKRVLRDQPLEVLQEWAHELYGDVPVFESVEALRAFVRKTGKGCYVMVTSLDGRDALIPFELLNDDLSAGRIFNTREAAERYYGENLVVLETAEQIEVWSKEFPKEPEF